MRRPSSTVECSVSAGCGALTLPRTLPQAEEGGGAALTSADASDTSTFASASARPQLQLAHAFRPAAPTSQSSAASGRGGRFRSSSVSSASSSISSWSSPPPSQTGAAGVGRRAALRSEKELPACAVRPVSSRRARSARWGAHLPGWLARAHSRHAGLAAHEAGQQQRAAQSLAPGRILRAKEGP